MATDTTALSYWLNWRFLLCALWVLADMVFAAFLIWKYEGRNRTNAATTGNQREAAGILYKDEAWTPCVKGIHPAWLMAFRVFAFLLMLALITGNTVADGGGIFIYYTQWTFTLVTVYFGLASAFSIYGCWHYRDGSGYKVANRNLDTERGTYVPPSFGDTASTSVMPKSCDNHQEHYVREIAGTWGYLFQILYQISAGAVVLTDVVFWLVLVPFFLAAVDYDLSFYVVSMHTVNAVLLGDTILNCMRFPVFRISYFILWTCTYVIFQWIIHALIDFAWPYPFLDLSSSYAPLWYVCVGVLHIPCYGIIALIVKLKHFWLSRSFPDSYLGMS